MNTHIVSKKNQIKSVLFVVILMTVTIIVILKEYSMAELIRVTKSIHPYYLIAGISMMILYVGCQAMNFYIILNTLKVPVKYRYCIEYAYVGNYFGAITPGASGAQPAQLYYMNKDNIHVDISAITVLSMVISSQIVILLTGGVLATLRFSHVVGYDRWLRYLMIAGGIVILFLTLLVFALMFMKGAIPFLFQILLKIGTKVRLIKNPKVLAAKFEAGILSYREKAKMLRRHPELIVKVFAVTMLQWFAYYMVTYLVYLSFGHREYGLFDLITGQSMISLAVAAVPLPGSVGIAENAYLHIFGQFYTPEELPSAMILSRLINFYLPLFISFFVYLHIHFRVIRQRLIYKKEN